MLTSALTARVIAPHLQACWQLRHLLAGQFFQTIVPSTIAMAPPTNQVTPAAILMKVASLPRFLQKFADQAIFSSTVSMLATDSVLREKRPTSLAPALFGLPALLARPCRSAAVQGAHRESYATCMCKDPLFFQQLTDWEAAFLKQLRFPKKTFDRLPLQTYTKEG